MKVGDTILGSCFMGDAIWDCLGNGLFIGGVGGALLRAKGLAYAKDDLVMGVPVCDDGDEVWPCSESELTDPRLCVKGAPRSRSFCCMRLQSSSNPS